MPTDPLSDTSKAAEKAFQEIQKVQKESHRIGVALDPKLQESANTLSIRVAQQSTTASKESLENTQKSIADAVQVIEANNKKLESIKQQRDLEQAAAAARERDQDSINKQRQAHGLAPLDSKQYALYAALPERQTATTVSNEGERALRRLQTSLESGQNSPTPLVGLQEDLIRNHAELEGIRMTVENGNASPENLRKMRDLTNEVAYLTSQVPTPAPTSPSTQRSPSRASVAPLSESAKTQYLEAAQAKLRQIADIMARPARNPRGEEDPKSHQQNLEYSRRKLAQDAQLLEATISAFRTNSDPEELRNSMRTAVFTLEEAESLFPKIPPTTSASVSASASAAASAPTPVSAPAPVSAAPATGNATINNPAPAPAPAPAPVFAPATAAKTRPQANPQPISAAQAAITAFDESQRANREVKNAQAKVNSASAPAPAPTPGKSKEELQSELTKAQAAAETAHSELMLAQETAKNDPTDKVAKEKVDLLFDKEQVANREVRNAQAKVSLASAPAPAPIPRETLAELQSKLESAKAVAERAWDKYKTLSAAAPRVVTAILSASGVPIAPSVPPEKQISSFQKSRQRTVVSDAEFPFATVNEQIDSMASKLETHRDTLRGEARYEVTKLIQALDKLKESPLNIGKRQQFNDLHPKISEFLKEDQTERQRMSATQRTESSSATFGHSRSSFLTPENSPRDSSVIRQALGFRKVILDYLAQVKDQASAEFRPRSLSSAR